jgi:signal transduction histidine kinase
MHFARMVDDLLDVSRISERKLTLQKRRTEAAALLDNAIETVLPEIQAADHTLVLNIPREPIMVDCDPVRIVQVFGNLLSNASKYTPSGGRIVIDVQYSADKVSISVKDNGVGIPGDMLPRIFEMFVHTEQNDIKGGLGIGLALSRRLVELHGGSIEARSAGLGQGSEFIVELPLESLEAR